MNIAKMMKQAQQMQKKMASMQEELAEQIVEKSVGGGKVVVTANGAGDVLSIKIDKAVVNPDDIEMLEDLVLLGVQQAIAEGKEKSSSEMGKLTEGMGLPPGMGL
ncbi:MAG: YbaB/EbfC family nucleoid-associated protein [Verrucomicrobiales bacterium]